MKDKGIFIKNVYYMLAYAFQVLRQNSYEDVVAEEFEEISDLFAEILFRGISRQLKQGLYRTYVNRDCARKVADCRNHPQSDSEKTTDAVRV